MKTSAALLLNPLLASVLFVGSVVAAGALFEKVPAGEPLHLLVAVAPLPFLFSSCSRCCGPIAATMRGRGAFWLRR